LFIILLFQLPDWHGRASIWFNWPGAPLLWDSIFIIVLSVTALALLFINAIPDFAAARDAGADVVAVLPHWGVEYTSAPTAKQRAQARALVAAGTTVILGSHSHWAGPIDLVDGRPVLYSLGNLIFDLTRSEETVESVIVEITFVGARPAQIRLHPTVMVDLVQPHLLDPAGDGTVVISRMRTASEALGEP
jgi:hypothetical protein